VNGPVFLPESIFIKSIHRFEFYGSPGQFRIGFATAIGTHHTANVSAKSSKRHGIGRYTSRVMNEITARWFRLIGVPDRAAKPCRTPGDMRARAGRFLIRTRLFDRVGRFRVGGFFMHHFVGAAFASSNCLRFEDASKPVGEDRTGCDPGALHRARTNSSLNQKMGFEMSPRRASSSLSWGDPFFPRNLPRIVKASDSGTSQNRAVRIRQAAGGRFVGALICFVASQRQLIRFDDAGLRDS